ncbi:helix-turn-helix domain-containing protein [Ochrobactrum intermedium]|uniref:LexA family protein n=1 Tax=Brucella intermedia TaxID=94625 RepID=UPI00159CBD41|nr:XRE family transcriptional regulator [Brucella intermedia]NVM42806.1 helix-turn-helix domain-containing protein [Brucella intermedia]
MNTQGERLMQAREAAGFRSAREAAEHFGWGYSTYASHENGQRGIRLDAARKYARAFKVNIGWLMTGNENKTNGAAEKSVISVPVIGKSAAGIWLEAEAMVLHETVTVPAVPSDIYPPDKQVAIKVEGPSMNKILPDGCFAIGVLIEAARYPQHNDIVAVRRTRAGLVETTIKRYLNIEGEILLMPESYDPAYKTAIEYRSYEDDTQVEIFALIIGSYQPFG